MSEVADTRAGGSLSIAATAVTAALVGFGSTVAIVVQAATAVGADPRETASWVAAICVGIAVTSLILSVVTRMPVITAWSTPGVALIAAGAGTYSLGEAVGAFLLVAALTVATGLIRPLQALVERIPSSVAAAMLAGVLVRFCLEVAGAAKVAPAIVLPMVVAFFVLRRWNASMAVPVILIAGIVAAVVAGAVAPGCCRIEMTSPVLVTPVFDIGAMIGLALPLFLVTMASQNLPGFAVLKADGYVPPVRPVLVTTGLVSGAIAPLGGSGVNLAAITAAICTGRDTHPDPARRWPVGIAYAAVYVVLAVFAATFVEVLGALPATLVIALAGLALFGPLLGALSGAFAVPDDREAALVTFLVTASGVAVLGIGSAFFGLVAGLAMVALARWKRG